MYRIVDFFKNEDIFCLGKKYLVYNLVNKNLKIKYRRSIFGVLWTLIAPLSTALVYYFVFKVILNIQREHFVAFILSGVMTWTFISQSISESLTCLVDNEGLLSKIPIPLHSFPFVINITNFVNLIFSVPIILSAAWLSGVQLKWNLIGLVYYFILLFITSYSISILLSYSYAFFRDLRHLINIILQLWFYMTPILYHESLIPSRYSWVLLLNPLSSIVIGVRSCILSIPFEGGFHILQPLFWTGGLFLFTIVINSKTKSGIVENL